MTRATLVTVDLAEIEKRMAAVIAGLSEEDRACPATVGQALRQAMLSEGVRAVMEHTSRELLGTLIGPPRPTYSGGTVTGRFYRTTAPPFHELPRGTKD